MQRAERKVASHNVPEHHYGNPLSSNHRSYCFLVPPDIVDGDVTSTDLSVQEGENATLSCNATGRPTPRISWKREDSKKILIRTGTLAANWFARINLNSISRYTSFEILLQVEIWSQCFYVQKRITQNSKFKILNWMWNSYEISFKMHLVILELSSAMKRTSIYFKEHKTFVMEIERERG